jgi:RNA polymerase sigma-70 factor, ECF subfamily
MGKSKESIQTIALNFIENKNNNNFKKLIERLKPGLSKFVYQYVKDNQLCNEVLSQTFIAIWEKIDQYKVQYNFSTWVYAIARNESLGILRAGNKLISFDNATSNTSSGKIYMYANTSTNMNIEVIGPTGEELITNLYDKVLNTIDQLQEPYKTVMIEREVKEKQLNTIAIELGWNCSTVKTRLRKARKDVANIIQDKYPELVELYVEKEE